MSVLQISLSEEMQERLNEKTKPIGVSNTSYVRMLLANNLGLLGLNQDISFDFGKLEDDEITLKMRNSIREAKKASPEDFVNL